MKHYRFSVLAFLLLLIIAEMIWSWRKDKKAIGSIAYRIAGSRCGPFT